MSKDLFVCPVCKMKNDETQKYCTGCGTWLLSERFPAVKHKSNNNIDRLYICSFCDTANEPGRNACKKCLKPLFSTDYETKEILTAKVSWFSKVLKFLMYTLTIVTIIIGLLSLIFAPSSKTLAIPLTLLVVSFIQLIFGLINPTIIPGKLSSRKKIFATYCTSIVVLFFVSAGMAPKSSVSSESIAVTTMSEKSNDKQSSAPVEKVVETEEQYKASATKVPYIDFARNPDNYKDKRVTYEGQVVQVVESGNNVNLRVNVTKNKYDLWEDTVFVNYRRQNGESRILEKDLITLWGVAKGLKTYQTVLGSQMSIPEIDAKYITITGNGK